MIKCILVLLLVIWLMFLRKFESSDSFYNFKGKIGKNIKFLMDDFFEHYWERRSKFFKNWK